MARISNSREIEFAQASGEFERRKQPRFPWAGAADVATSDSGPHYHGEMKELSLTGCYIVGDTPLNLDRRDCVQLCLYVDGKMLCIPARVILVRPNSGAAFEFVPIHRQMRSSLLDMLEKLSCTGGLSEQLLVG